MAEVGSVAVMAVEGKVEGMAVVTAALTVDAMVEEAMEEITTSPVHVACGTRPMRDCIGAARPTEAACQAVAQEPCAQEPCAPEPDGIRLHVRRAHGRDRRAHWRRGWWW